MLQLVSNQLYVVGQVLYVGQLQDAFFLAGCPAFGRLLFVLLLLFARGGVNSRRLLQFLLALHLFRLQLDLFVFF